MKVRNCALGLVVGVLAFAAAGQDAAPDTGIVDGKIALGAGQTARQVTVFTTALDPQKANGAVLAIEEVGEPAVKFSNPRLLGNPGKRLEWTVTATAENFPSETTSTRTAALTITSGTEVLLRRGITYTLTNRSAAVTWTLTGPGDTLMVPPNDHAAFFISVTGGPSKVTGLRSTLKNEETGEKLPETALRVCASPAVGNCGTPVLQPGTPTRVFLVVDEEALGDLPAGKFTGAVDLAIEHAADLKSFTLTIYRSSSPLRLAGLGVIFLGVLTSLLGTILLRNAAARAEALLPAAVLRETIVELEAKLAGCGRTRQNAPQAHAALDAVASALETKKLVAAGYVPQWITNPFTVPAPASGYSEFLKKWSERLIVLRHLIDRGYCRIETLRRQHPNPQHAAHFNTAFAGVDKLATDPNATTVMLDQEIAKIENTLLQNIGVPGFEALVAGKAAAPPTSEQLMVRLQTLNAGVWLLFAVVTTVLGYVVLIAPAFGFGTARDFANAFLWGLGVQTAGQSLQTLTPATVTTAFGMRVPR